MRALAAILLVACGDAALVSPPDAPPPRPDALVAAEDLDLTVDQLAGLTGWMTPAGRTYQVANPLGHEAEALAAAESPTGAVFPVGTVVEAQPAEVMVKRRAGFDATTADWEFFGVTLQGGRPVSFNVRGVEETGCFACHAMVSSAKWGFICEHP